MTAEPSTADPFAAARRVLFLHAHPDDETLSTGGTIAMLTARGSAVTVLTGTRGERGDVVDGPLKRLEGTPELAGHRVEELAGAMRALGVGDQRFLGAAGARAVGRPVRVYEDSGMVWRTPSIAAAAPDSGPGTLSRAPLEEVVGDIRAVIAGVRPDLVVTYNDQGGYGHPDHVRMHDAGVLAAGRAGLPIALIEPCEGDDGPAPFRLDVSPWLDRKIAALSAHRSQLTVLGGSYRLSGGQLHRLEAVECFRIHRADPALRRRGGP